MKPITLEWIDKAEAGWVTAQREMRARKLPNFDAACFHAQQCAEKYLKARLEEAGLPFGKTHNLIAVVTLALAVEPTWAILQPHLNALNVYAVAYRYPGTSASKGDANDAIKACREVRRRVREAFGLPL